MKRVFIIFLSIALISICFENNAMSKVTFFHSGNDTLKAQIEMTIISGGTERYVKVFDKVRRGEKFQIHIKTEAKYNLTIINSNKSSTEILIDTTINPNSVQTFPSQSKYFIFDGKETIEKLTVCLSIGNNLNKNMKKLSNKDFLEYLKKISTQSKCNISELGEPLININGNLREVSGTGFNFTKYYGINYLIKEFQFNVKK